MMSQKKRLLFIVQNAPPLNSGRACQAIKLADKLREKHWHIDILSLDDQRFSENKAIDKCTWRRSFSCVKRNSLFIARLALQRGYQAVHFHGFCYATGLTGFLKKLGIRTLLNMSSQGFDDPCSLLNQQWLSNRFRRSLHALDAWIVQNPKDQIDQPNALYVPNIVDIPRQVEPFDERNKQILCLGVVCERKGQLQLIKDFAAMPGLAQNGWKLLLCGSYDHNYYEYNRDYVNACLELAAKTPNVQMLGHLKGSQLSELLAHSKMFTALSLREGLSNAYLEALANGMRPILPHDREDDLFCDLNLSQKALRWSVSPKFVSAMENTAWYTSAISWKVARRFSANQVLDKLEQLYTHGHHGAALTDVICYRSREKN
jgi:glycosyltransferase involved in cell wall biosynthesis